jgi:NitT/TauT family transport system permease protein
MQEHPSPEREFDIDDKPQQIPVVVEPVAASDERVIRANRDHLLLARTLGASRRQLFAKFILPSAVPTIFAGLQLGLTYSFLTAVVGEMLSGATGLGAKLAVTLATYRTDDFFAALFLLALVATALSNAMRLVERRLLRWRQYELSGLRTPDA